MSETANAIRPFKRARAAFDIQELKRICEMHETEFAAAFDMEVTVDERLFIGDEYADFHLFKDNGADILAVAHLDTVVSHKDRTTRWTETQDGTVIHSGALDDRLGAYTILKMLPLLGINVDIVFTTGEERGRSTGQHFDPPAGKNYKWIIEFDRGGTDVVMYDYETAALRELVKDCGARVGIGSFSDISYMEHLGIKGFNWGVGYDGNYHGPRGYVYVNDYLMMIGQFIKFHEANKDLLLQHTPDQWGSSRGRSGSLWGRDDDDVLCPLECGDTLWGGYCYTCEVDNPFERADMIANGIAQCEHGVEPSDYCQECDAVVGDVVDAEIVDGDSVIDNPSQEDHDALDDAIAGYYRKRLKGPTPKKQLAARITADTSMFSEAQTKRLLDAGHSEHVG